MLEADPRFITVRYLLLLHTKPTLDVFLKAPHKLGTHESEYKHPFYSIVILCWVMTTKKH